MSTPDALGSPERRFGPAELTVSNEALFGLAVGLERMPAPNAEYFAKLFRIAEKLSDPATLTEISDMLAHPRYGRTPEEKGQKKSEMIVGFVKTVMANGAPPELPSALHILCGLHELMEDAIKRINPGIEPAEYVNKVGDELSPQLAETIIAKTSLEYWLLDSKQQQALTRTLEAPGLEARVSGRNPELPAIYVRGDQAKRPVKDLTLEETRERAIDNARKQKVKMPGVKIPGLEGTVKVGKKRFGKKPLHYHDVLEPIVEKKTRIAGRLKLQPLDRFSDELRDVKDASGNVIGKESSVDRDERVARQANQVIDARNSLHKHLLTQNEVQAIRRRWEEKGGSHYEADDIILGNAQAEAQARLVLSDDIRKLAKFAGSVARQERRKDRDEARLAALTPEEFERLERLNERETKFYNKAFRSAKTATLAALAPKQAEMEAAYRKRFGAGADISGIQAQIEAEAGKEAAIQASKALRSRKSKFDRSRQGPDKVKLPNPLYIPPKRQPKLPK